MLGRIGRLRAADKPAAPEEAAHNAPQPAPLQPFVSLPGERWWAAAIVIAHLALSLGFSFGPLYEGPDEIAHYKFVRYLVERRQLPGPPYEAGTGGETHQAPLYYLLNGLVSQFLPDGDFVQRLSRSNPYHGVEAGVANNFNKNSRFHYRIESFPYTQSEATLALHVLRLSSVLFTTLAVAAAYLVYRLLWPGRPDLRLMALGLISFWPQMLFMSGTLNNDNLVILGGTLSLLWMLRISEHGPSPARSLILGAALGVAILAKSSAMFLVLPVGALVLLDHRTWRAAPLIAAAALLGGWWYIRNLFVYGEPTGYTLFYQFLPGAKVPFGTMPIETWLKLITIVPYYTLWARFGDGTVGVGDYISHLFDVMAALSLVGLAVGGYRAIRAARQRKPDPASIRRVVILGLYTLAWTAALGYIAYTSRTGITGRVVLPGLAGTGALMAAGLLALTPERLRMRVALSSVALMAAAAAVCLFGYFRLSYLPDPVPAAIEKPLSYRFQGDAEVIGTQLDTVKARPGGVVEVVVYWRALRPTRREMMTYLHSVDSQIVRRDSFPGEGNLPSTDWLPGQTWAERYIVAVPPDAEAQSVITLVAGLYDPATDAVVEAVDASGADVLPVVGRLAINGPARPFDPDYRFGGAIGLAEPEISTQGGQTQVCLRWLSIAPVTIDYHEYIHILSPEGAPLGQSDFAPKEGRYPTSAWATGETVGECATLDTSGLADGWRVTIGLYDPISGARLPVVDRAGRSLANDELPIAPGG